MTIQAVRHPGPGSGRRCSHAAGPAGRPGPAFLPTGLSTSLAAPAISLALGLAICGNFLVPDPASRGGGLLLLALGVAAFTLVGFMAPSGAQPLAPSEPIVARGAGAPWGLWSGLALAAAVDAAGLAVWALSGDPNLAWLLFSCSLAVLLATAWALAGRPRPALRRPTPHQVAVLAVLVLAAGLRLYNLGEQPLGLWRDEARTGLGIERIIASPGDRPIFNRELVREADEPSLFWYVSAPFVVAWGSTPLALRLSPALGGTLSVLGLYLLARELGGRRYALIAAALLAVMAWHLNFSRIAFNAVWSVALDALAAVCFVRMLHRRSVVDGLLGGLCLGLGLQMYYPSRLLPVVLALFGLHRLAVERLDLARRVWAPVLAFAVAATIAVSPLLLYAALHPDDFTTRMSETTIFSRVGRAGPLAALQANVGKYALMFNVAGDSNGRHNLPRAPMLDPVTGALFVTGLLYCLARLRRPGAFLPVVWMPVMLLPGILSTSAPHALRSLDEVVAVALLAALPALMLREGWQALLAPLAGRRAAELAAALVVISLAWIAWLNVDRYFVQMARDVDVAGAFSLTQTLIAREASTLPPGTPVLLDESYLDDPSIAFLAPQLGRHRAFNFSDQASFRDQREVAIFLAPRAADTVTALLRSYPLASVVERRAPGDPRVLLFYSLRIPAKEPTASRSTPAV